MNYNTIRYEVDDYILTLTLNRPDQLNAFTVEMAGELLHAFQRASDDDEVRVVVVTGAGRGFCAGMDLSGEGNTGTGNVFGIDESQSPTLQDMHEKFDDPNFYEGVRDDGGKIALAIYECNKPVIAAINGAAVGVGASMTCAMDIRIASEKARVGFVFNKVGIVPEACSSWFLPRVVGISTALEWVYTAEILDAKTLHDANFVKSVVPPDQLMDEAYTLAKKIAAYSPVSVTLERHMMYRNSAQAHPEEAHKIDSLAIFYASQSSGKEGVAAFLEKRTPAFTEKASKDLPDFFPWWK